MSDTPDSPEVPEAEGWALGPVEYVIPDLSGPFVRLVDREVCLFCGAEKVKAQKKCPECGHNYKMWKALHRVMTRLGLFDSPR